MDAMPNQLQIFTIGHSSHALGSFVWLLRKHRIEALLDIRRFPGSRKHPHFCRESLSASLQEEDIEYHWLEALGGRRHRKKTDPPSPNPGLRDQSFRNYADYMASDEFQQGVAKLLAIAGNRRTVIMCAEGLYWQCHRRLVSDHLLANGVGVQHIFPNGEVKPHMLTAGAKAESGAVTYPGQPTLFRM
ncbi:MAG: DUF488 domain-containing protein [Planctomycetaceae bacterium]|nr:DUF488 domain-containing protein [Planctomycetaceae bacterium]